MDDSFQEDIKFDAAGDAAETGDGLLLDIEGYEGPLHLLLELARQQRVDLTRLSVLELAEQYLAFIKSAQNLRIELAADYLVMAAWLAYLKSRLILPKPEDTEKPAEGDELAAHLAFRLQRLEAMRRAADGLFRLPMLDREVYSRGAPEGLRSRTTPLWEATLYDMLEAYGSSRSKAVIRNHKLPTPAVMSLEDARARLKRALADFQGSENVWTDLESLLPTEQEFASDVPRSSIKASSLVAGLELAKNGIIDIRQTETFAPIYIRQATGKETS